MASYSEFTISSKNMLAGLKANRKRLTRAGIDDQFMIEYEDVYQNTLRLNDEQQALKARLKEKTAAVHESMDLMIKFHSKARSRVKTELQKESWKEFGIQATQ